jgi:hypothetical protein
MENRSALRAGKAISVPSSMPGPGSHFGRRDELQVVFADRSKTRRGWTKLDIAGPQMPGFTAGSRSARPGGLARGVIVS